MSFEALAEDAQPVQITQSEYMRRMKEMAAMQRGMGFYGELPDSYSLIVNTEHPLVKAIFDDARASLADATAKEAEIESLNKSVADLRGKKDVTDEEKKSLANNETRIEQLRKEENATIAEYAEKVPQIRQLIDIALLGNNLLRGEALADFLRRSVELMKK